MGSRARSTTKAAKSEPWPTFTMGMAQPCRALPKVWLFEERTLKYRVQHPFAFCILRFTATLAAIFQRTKASGQSITRCGRFLNGPRNTLESLVVFGAAAALDCEMAIYQIESSPCPHAVHPGASKMSARPPVDLPSSAKAGATESHDLGWSALRLSSTVPFWLGPVFCLGSRVCFLSRNYSRASG